MAKDKNTEEFTPAKKGGFPLRNVVAGIIGVLALVIIVQNSASTPVHLFGWTVTLPLWLLLLIFFVAGVLLSGLVRGGVRRMRGKDPSP